MPVRTNMADEETKDVEMEEEEEDDSEEDSDEGESDEESGDSDKELQIAFEKGLLKPGLFQEVEKTKKEHVNNVEGLKAALNNLTTKNKFDWAERLDVTTQPVPDATGTTTTAEEQPTEKNASKEETVHNDFQREMAIHRQAQAGWLEALAKLRKLGIPTKRPDDFFAQMVKDDSHMRRVREKILSKQQSVELSEKMRKLRELKKYGKKVQQEVLAKRQKEKKNLADSVKKYRQGVKDKLDFMKNDDFGGIEAEDGGRKGKNNNNNSNKKMAHQPNRKRMEKNKKFGHGGQKKRSKYNTAESSADPFSGPKGKGKKFPGEVGRGGGGRGGKKGGGARGGGKHAKMARPGKSKRVANKNKKRS